jgi:tetratricopeptide (TPR) repeat protein
MVMESPTPMQERGPSRAVYLAAAATALLVGLVFLPVLGNGFVNWDDGLYVDPTPLGRALPAAFARFHSSGNWHPLSNLSHAVDFAIFGAWPAGHHLGSLLLHSLCAGLVVLLAVALLGARASQGLGRRGRLAAGVAAGLLWGLHPLRVEPAAWVSERKELLCALFFLLGLLAYLHHASATTTRRWYLTTLLCFGLALLSKPMAVSFPLVLLLLDAYPLARLRRPGLGRVLAEKIPFVLLAAAAAVVTWYAQHSAGAMRALTDVPLDERFSVALQATVAYLGKTLWPTELRALYSYPASSSPLAFRLIAAASVLGMCWVLKRQRRQLLTALVAYLVLLLPVLGLVQVGPQAMAERYTYLPGIALAVLAGAGFGLLWERAAASSRFWLACLLATLGLVCASLAWLTVRQIAVWHDGASLWNQVLACEPDNVEAHNSRADLYYRRGDYRRALDDYDAALAGRMPYAAAHADKRRAAILNDRAVALVQLGQLDRAVADASEAIRLQPDRADYLANRARMYQRLGRIEEANRDWQRARELHARTVPTSAGY